VIDIHCHLLPGVDDGPGSMREAVAMARVAVDNGIRTMVCTPHVHERYVTGPDAVMEGVGRLGEALAREEVPLEVLPGGEIALSILPRLDDDDLRGLSLGGGGWLLLELPFRGWPIGLGETLRDLEIRGFRAVLAHPERAESVQLAPDRLRDVVGRGALLQITAGSFTGEHGARSKRAAQTLARNGLLHFLASDAHSAGWRPPELRDGLAAAAAELRLPEEDVAWTVTEGPRLVIEGRDVRPPRLTRERRLRGAERRERTAPPRPRRTSA
jgi:protein-tyrosine phosphatase